MLNIIAYDIQNYIRAVFVYLYNSVLGLFVVNGNDCLFSNTPFFYWIAQSVDTNFESYKKHIIRDFLITQLNNN
jgi:hypothetical protein